MPRATEWRRRNRTLLSARRAHGATDSNTPAIHGLFNTLIHYAECDELADLLSRSDTVHSIVGRIVAPKVRQFEESKKNVIRSIALLYRGGILSKRKYRAIHASYIRQYQEETKSCSTLQVVPGLRVPRTLPYNKVMKYVRGMDIGELCPLPQVEGLMPVPGFYRPLKCILATVAELFLSNTRLKDSLVWFGKGEGNFAYAVGGDGAPLGQGDEGMTLWCISILNRGRHVGSPSDNFLLLAAGCEEEHPVLLAYARQLAAEAEALDGQQVEIAGTTCTFSCRLLPVDMKWLAIYSGELPNSARYFSSFANVCNKEKGEAGVFGESCSFGPQPKWLPWTWEQRVEAWKKVGEFKKKLKGDPTDKANRAKVLDYMALKLQCRQETAPPLGKLVQLAKVEPLHLMNNCWQVIFQLVVSEAITVSKLARGTKTDNLPPDSPFAKLLHVVRQQMKCNMLFKRTKMWFDDKSPGTPMSKYVRFRGRESRACCHNVHHLVECIVVQGASRRSTVRCHVFNSLMAHMRDATALFSRYSISQKDVHELRKHGRAVLNALNIWFAEAITPTIWTLAYVASVHSDQMLTTFGYGLGLNTAQGREGKVLIARRFFANSLPNERWRMLFVHEFMTSVWLRQYDPQHDDYHGGHQKYRPKGVENGKCCHCGAQRGPCPQCEFCADNFHELVEKTLATGEMPSSLLSLFTPST